VLALGVTPATAGATPQDIAATHAYIQAGYALARVSVASLGRVQARIESYDERLRQECPRAGAGSPEDEASQVASNEAADALWSIGYGTDAPQIHAFFERTRGLRWSNAAITRAAHAFAGDLNELATSPLPDLCSDVAAWKQTAFQSFPAASATIVSRIQAIEPVAVPARLLAPYERGSDAGLYARTSDLEGQIGEFEFVHGQADWDQLLETLALNQ
jgi:hypothetical protein